MNRRQWVVALTRRWNERNRSCPTVMPIAFAIAAPSWSSGSPGRTRPSRLPRSLETPCPRYRISRFLRSAHAFARCSRRSSRSRFVTTRFSRAAVSRRLWSSALATVRSCIRLPAIARAWRRRSSSAIRRTSSPGSSGALPAPARTPSGSSLRGPPRLSTSRGSGRRAPAWWWDGGVGHRRLRTGVAGAEPPEQMGVMGVKQRRGASSTEPESGPVHSTRQRPPRASSSTKMPIAAGTKGDVAAQ